MIRIAICDDEKIMCDTLQKNIAEILQNTSTTYSIDCYTNAEQFYTVCQQYHLLFLDIDMPNCNGVTLAKNIRKNQIHCEIIFVTILKEYVLNAFEVEALDYIYKPIDTQRLQNALKRAIKKLQKQQQKFLLIQTKYITQNINISQIYYIEVINRKIYVHTQHDTIEYYSKLEQVQKQLDERFIKCHRSYIVNMDYFYQYQNNMITLQNGQTVPVSRLRQKELLYAMLQYMKGEQQ